MSTTIAYPFGILSKVEGRDQRGRFAAGSGSAASQNTSTRAGFDGLGGGGAVGLAGGVGSVFAERALKERKFKGATRKERSMRMDAHAAYKAKGSSARTTTKTRMAADRETAGGGSPEHDYRVQAIRRQAMEEGALRGEDPKISEARGDMMASRMISRLKGKGAASSGAWFKSQRAALDGLKAQRGAAVMGGFHAARRALQSRSLIGGLGGAAIGAGLGTYAYFRNKDEAKGQKAGVVGRSAQEAGNALRTVGGGTAGALFGTMGGTVVGSNTGGLLGGRRGKRFGANAGLATGAILGGLGGGYATHLAIQREKGLKPSPKPAR